MYAARDPEEPPLPPVLARVLVRDCDPELLRKVVAEIAAPPASPELLARLPNLHPDHDTDAELLTSYDLPADQRLPFTLPLRATYFCGMVERNVWENVTVTIEAYDGGGSLQFSMPVHRRWQHCDSPHGGGPEPWPGQTEWYRASQEQFFLSLSMALTPARVTLVWGANDALVVLSTWDEAFMGASARDALEALDWNKERERDCNIQCARAPWAYLIQHLFAKDLGAAKLERAATQPFGENSDDDVWSGDDEWYGDEDQKAGLCYEMYHTYYDHKKAGGAGQDERNTSVPWLYRSRYKTWQRLCWLDSFDYDIGMRDGETPLGRAMSRALLRGTVCHEAADALPPWSYDSTLAGEAHNMTLLQLHTLGLRSGRAAPLEFFRFMRDERPLLDVAACRTRLHHAARLIQRAWHRASNNPDYALARKRVAALMRAEDEDTR
jgi:hypothetical protein